MKSSISWLKKQLKIFLCSIKTKVAIKFPTKLFFSLPKISLALKGLIGILFINQKNSFITLLMQERDFKQSLAPKEHFIAVLGFNRDDGILMIVP